MKILFVTPDFGYGGAERVMSLLMGCLCRRGDEVVLTILKDRGSTTFAYPLSEGISVLFVSPLRRNCLKSIVCHLRQFRQVLRHNSPDVAVSFFYDTAALLRLVSLGMKIPIVYSERNDPNNNIKGVVPRICEYIATRKSSHVVFQSRNVQLMFPNSVRRKSTVIFNPLDISNLPLRRAEDVESIIVSVGRLSVQKNQLLLIDAFSIFVKTHPDYRLYIYGEGEQRSMLEKAIIDKGLEYWVFLPGSEKNVLEKIKNARIFAFSSNFEGMPNALMEAMVMGIPCVTTDFSPGCASELIENKKNGLIVPCGDKYAMAGAFELLAENVDEAEEMGNNAKKISDKVNLINISRLWIQLFEQIAIRNRV